MPTRSPQRLQHARTSMGWLDARDPGFAALKLWLDVNADGNSANEELQSLAQANITATNTSHYLLRA